MSCSAGLRPSAPRGKRNRYFNELGATKLACLWVLEHCKKDGKKMEERLSGYFDDDGTGITSDLVPEPGLCLSCAKEDETVR